ncbi:uncharacterized protein [Rutidosis leptorrhynchoides]|uniref:uncharacterized protein n=1 Tax=Rutidosis leptorrhynchoides TaxID=125765 RepID=UPI003A9A0563
MPLYIDEEQLWKCPKHPSRRRKSGICPKCLRDRLVTLCPNCANSLPCPECPAPIEITSSSNSPFSLFSFSRGGSHRRDFSNHNESNRSSNSVEGDPVLRKSRSVAIPLLRSKSKYVGNVTEIEKAGTGKVSRSKINFWSVFKVNKSKRCDVKDEIVTEGEVSMCDDLTRVNGDLTAMMTRSRSVAVNGNEFGRSKGWYFSSSVKSFRQSKLPTSVIVA